ncbi:YihY/virulence factor BrkB family protein [Ferruginibacter albus]|uniref:YihY/virulence factor BrkB family protein n=1 Tax=Ferruginibacter albus TaxID=2875540 RepID=UPI001CC6D035|nr:YihY/virulence factor BrkB family protein [Ferruginibacter albus]UAY51055.1 YihY/virulence factor BrkB family protein [Ferruginibacter albus]
MLKIERIILTTPPISFVVRKSKHWILPGFEGVPLFDVLKFFRKQLKTASLTERASAISYNFIMAIPPSLLFLFTLLPSLPFIKKLDLKKQLTFLIRDIIPAKGYNDSIINFINSTFFQSPRIELISTSLILALFFASNGMIGLMRSFNKNYLGFEKRHWLRSRWIAIRLTMLIFGLVLSCLILLVTQRTALKWIGIQSAAIRETIIYLRWILIVTLMYYSIAFIYKLAPAVKKRWSLKSPGTILAASLSLLATYGFSTFVNNFGRYNALYGSISAIIVLMALIYINSLMLLIGFELNVSINSLKAIAEHRMEEEKKKTSTTTK